jgi:hypothetical protein
MLQGDDDDDVHWPSGSSPAQSTNKYQTVEVSPVKNNWKSPKITDLFQHKTNLESLFNNDTSHNSLDSDAEDLEVCGLGV